MLRGAKVVNFNEWYYIFFFFWWKWNYGKLFAGAFAIL